MNKSDEAILDEELWEIQLRYISLVLSANRRYGHYEVISNKSKKIKEVK